MKHLIYTLVYKDILKNKNLEIKLLIYNFLFSQFPSKINT